MRNPHARNTPVWRPIPHFDNYDVSDTGEVRNVDGRILNQHVNPSGVAYVSLWNGRTRSRSVALLVAKAFLEEPWSEAFDTPIHLDGNRLNNAATNLAWRPRWFAIKFVEQFNGYYADQEHKIEILETGEITTCWDVCKRFGLLYANVLAASASNEPRNKSPWGTEFSFDYVGNSY